MPTLFELEQEMLSIGRHLPVEQSEKLLIYLNGLLSWNKKIRLIGPEDWRVIFHSLLADSFYLADFLDSLNLQQVEPFSLDLGAGAGLPGLPLRLLWPWGKYWLVEPKKKRVAFLERMLSQMHLDNTHVFQGLAKEAAEYFFVKTTAFLEPQKADVCLSRAFMPPKDFLDLASQLVTPAGTRERAGIIIIMTNEPLELESLAKKFSLVAEMSYRIAEIKVENKRKQAEAALNNSSTSKTRYLLAFTAAE